MHFGAPPQVPLKQIQLQNKETKLRKTKTYKPNEILVELHLACALELAEIKPGLDTPDDL